MVALSFITKAEEQSMMLGSVKINRKLWLVGKQTDNFIVLVPNTPWWKFFSDPHVSDVVDLLEIMKGAGYVPIKIFEWDWSVLFERKT